MIEVNHFFGRFFFYYFTFSFVSFLLFSSYFSFDSIFCMLLYFLCHGICRHSTRVLDVAVVGPRIISLS